MVCSVTSQKCGILGRVVTRGVWSRNSGLLQISCSLICVPVTQLFVESTEARIGVHRTGTQGLERSGSGVLRVGQERGSGKQRSEEAQAKVPVRPRVRKGASRYPAFPDQRGWREGEWGSGGNADR